MVLIRSAALLVLISLMVSVGLAQNDPNEELQSLLNRRGELKTEMEAANQAGDHDKYNQLLEEWESVSEQIKALNEQISKDIEARNNAVKFYNEGKKFYQQGKTT
ncbi:MAG TPA: hypothetical protein ENF16_00705, partial [Bacteroidetes bacterium]|nr:hypothetical protein [Bacteroidota bacterium]